MNEKWKVVYYVSQAGNVPVRDFLDKAGPSVKTKALRILMHVEEYGIAGIIPYVKKLIGTPLWEIRIVGGDSVRILFVTQRGKTVLLLHAFYKKTQKTPQKDIAVALGRLNDHERKGNA